MKASKKGIDIIKKYEGFRNTPYLCPANVPTIGFGSTFYEDGRSVKLTDKPITRKRAEQLLKNVLNKYEEEVNYSVTSSINQNQFDALVSFNGRIISSTLVGRNFIVGLYGDFETPRGSECTRMTQYIL